LQYSTLNRPDSFYALLSPHAHVVSLDQEWLKGVSPPARAGWGFATDQALSLAAIASSLRSIAFISARSSGVGIGILAMFTFTPDDWFHPCSCAALLTIGAACPHSFKSARNLAATAKKDFRRNGHE